MAANLKLELKVIRKFVTKDKQTRFNILVSTDGKRKKFIDELAHFRHLKFDLFENLKDISTSELVKKLVVFKDCYAISENNDIDSKRVDVAEAIGKTVGYGMGTLLVFGDAEAVYYEGEAINDRWISKNPNK